MSPPPPPLCLPRHPQWPERLAALVEARRHMPFAWGSNDCALFAGDATQAINGADPLAHLRGRWRCERSALRLLQRLGGLPAAAAAVWGRPVPAAGAHRGAIVCVPLEGRPTLGVLLGNGTWCAPGEAGLVFRPRAEVTHAWNL